MHVRDSENAQRHDPVKKWESLAPQVLQETEHHVVVSDLCRQLLHVGLV